GAAVGAGGELRKASRVQLAVGEARQRQEAVLDAGAVGRGMVILSAVRIVVDFQGIIRIGDGRERRQVFLFRNRAALQVFLGNLGFGTRGLAGQTGLELLVSRRFQLGVGKTGQGQVLVAHAG